MLNPTNAVGLIARETEEGLIVLGTAFAFRQPTTFLTAAHCVSGVGDNLQVLMFAPGGEVGFKVKEAVKHPSADISIIETQDSRDDVTPFWNFVSNYEWGEEFIAFGYPEDIFGERRSVTPRLFRGYFQRIYAHRSYRGYEYKAAELSIGAPAGLSGGPLFRPGAPAMLTGFVTENLESTTVLHSIEERERDGNITRDRYQKVLTYGVALLLDGVEEWLNERVAPHHHAG